MSNGVPHDSIYPANAAESLAKYRLIMEASSDALLFVRSDGMIVDANHGAESMYGLDRSELLSMTIWDLRAPDTHSHIGIQMNVAMTSGAAFETMHRRKDGSLLAVEVSSRGASLMGVPVLLSVVRDVSRRKRQESIQTLLSEIDQLLRRDDSLESALAHVCEGLSGVLELPLLWIGLKVPDGSVLVKARGGPYGHMVESLAVRWDKTTGGTGPTGEALRTGRAQLVSLETAVPEQPWWPSVQELGLRHALIVPIVCRAEVLGTVSLYSRRPEGFPDDAVGLAQHFADHLGLMLIEARERDQIRLQTAALNAAANAIVIVDTAGRITWANEAFSVLTGYTADEVIGQNPRILKSGLTADSVFADLWSTIVAGNIWTGELMNRRKDGTIYVDQQTITPVRGSSGEITHFVGIKLDGTEKRQQEEHLRYLANHDPLTGFQNRRGFLELLNRRRGNPDELNALLMIDLDNFKLINDTFGHAAGDTALLTVAGVIRRFLRQSDCTARYGGDEFAVLLHGVNEDGAVGVAERIRRALQTSRVGECGQCITLSASIGVAMVPTGAVIDEIMSLADEALATAKASGKNQTVVFRPDSTGSAQARNVWPSRIKAAAVQGNLVLHYQPIVRLDDNGVEYSEAFLRMKGTKDRLLYPSEFLPHAYRFGLTPELDLWVTRSVLHRMAVNRGLRVAVNLSGQTLQDREVLSSIERAVAERRPRPGDLTFEISESTAVQDLHRMNDWIQRMKQLGCRFALDDFGTGASSFEHLRSLSVDTVKIDGSYIRTLLSDPSCLAFVDAINSLCSSLGMVTVAECVETPAVAEMLARIGVRFGQGYLWGRPTAIDGLRM